VPRDRNSEFDPVIVGKRQTRLTQFDDQILSLYAKGMSTRDIVAAFEDMYGAKVSANVISSVTQAVLDKVTAWQSRSLDQVYPILYLDGLVVKVRQDKRVINKTIYVALGVNLQGEKELLGLWIAETEGAKFWLSVLTELYQRGAKDFFIICVDGLSGFPEAIETQYPKSKIQLCIVHLIRNACKYVSWKDRKALCGDLKQVYTSATAQEAEQELQAFADKWDDKYPVISKSWRTHWPNIITLFDYPDEIRKVIYTTNAIESLNSQIRKAIKNRRIFPNDNSAMKVVYLAIESASKRWTMPIRNWKKALNRFAIEFENRMPNQ
jgi:transposase-like protein